MELGTRSIRSSGRGSGSIEITLPSSLRALGGLACEVIWNDRPTPHIMLVPDLKPARAALGRIWDKLLAALALPPGPPPVLTIHLAAQTRSGLLWEDALALSAPGPHEAVAVSRVIAALAALAQPAAPPDFAASLAFLATGAVPEAAYGDDCAIAAAAFPTRAAAPMDGFGLAFWQALADHARPLLAFCQALEADPARRATLQAALQAALRAGTRPDLRGLLP